MPEDATPKTTTTRAAGRPREHDGSTELEELIFVATEGLMRDVPFNDLSVAQVIKAAGVSRATFYFYFSSKFSVLTGLLDRAMNDVFATVQPFVGRPSGESPEDALRRSLRQVTRVWRDHRLVLQATSQHWHAVPELRARWMQIAERFIVAGAEEIERERETGLLQATAPSRQLAAMLFWGTERCLHIAGLGSEPSFADETAIEDALVAMWLGTLYGTPRI